MKGCINSISYMGNIYIDYPACISPGIDATNLVSILMWDVHGQVFSIDKILMIEARQTLTAKTRQNLIFNKKIYCKYDYQCIICIILNYKLWIISAQPTFDHLYTFSRLFFASLCFYISTPASIHLPKYLGSLVTFFCCCFTIIFSFYQPSFVNFVCIKVHLRMWLSWPTILVPDLTLPQFCSAVPC